MKVETVEQPVGPMCSQQRWCSPPERILYLQWSSKREDCGREDLHMFRGPLSGTLKRAQKKRQFGFLLLSSGYYIKIP